MGAPRGRAGTRRWFWGWWRGEVIRRRSPTARPPSRRAARGKQRQVQPIDSLRSAPPPGQLPGALQWRKSGKSSPSTPCVARRPATSPARCKEDPTLSRPVSVLHNPVVFSSGTDKIRNRLRSGFKKWDSEFINHKPSAHCDSQVLLYCPKGFSNR